MPNPNEPFDFTVFGLPSHEYRNKFKDYFKDLEDISKYNRTMWDKEKCLHMNCPYCHGTGIKNTGEACVHTIACSCPRCTPRC